MALSTVNDYKAAFFKILSSLPRDIDPGVWARGGGLTPADAKQIADEYEAWRLARSSRIHPTHKKTAK